MRWKGVKKLCGSAFYAAAASNVVNAKYVVPLYYKVTTRILAGDPDTGVRWMR